jgi:hypothetical protein
MTYPEWKKSLSVDIDAPVPDEPVNVTMKPLRFRESGRLTDSGNNAIIDPVGLNKTLHDVEEAKRGLKHEVGTLIARDGVVLKEYGGTAHAVSVPVPDYELFEGNIFTHNHPGGRCFTVQDIMSFVENRLYEVRASTPQGTFFSLREGGEEVNRSIANVMKEEKVGDILKADMIIRQRGLDLQGKARQEMVYDLMSDDVDVWLTENVGEFGYVYTKGGI